MAVLLAGALAACGGASPMEHAVPPPSAAAPGTPSSRPSEPSATGPTAEPGPTTAAPAGTGHVKNGVHTGDLRYFLLAAPADADVYGDPAGEPLTADDIASASTDTSGALAALKAYGFRGGVSRTYLTADGASEVTVKLVRFGGPAKAAEYYTQHSFEGTKLALGEGFPARGYHMASGSAESTDAVLAFSYQGDVQITITLTTGESASRSMLASLLDAQYQRLKTGH